MPKKLLPTPISTRLLEVPKGAYCSNALEGQGGTLEVWYCPYFEGRFDHAPIEKQWGHCHHLRVTVRFNDQSGSLLWDLVKHYDCPEHQRLKPVG